MRRNGTGYALLVTLAVVGMLAIIGYAATFTL